MSTWGVNQPGVSTNLGESTNLGGQPTWGVNQPGGSTNLGGQPTCGVNQPAGSTWWVNLECQPTWWVNLGCQPTWWVNLGCQSLIFTIKCCLASFYIFTKLKNYQTFQKNHVSIMAKFTATYNQTKSFLLKSFIFKDVSKYLFFLVN